MEYTTLHMTVDDGETNFDVPTDWLENMIGCCGYQSLDAFMEDYDSCDSSEIYAYAILDGLIH